MPPTCHLYPSEPHRNLIGTSSESHRMMSVSSSSYYRDLNNSHLIWFSLTLYKKNHIALANMRFFYYLCGAIYSIVVTMRTTITIFPATMEHKSCPRCGATFICQHENPAKCQCAGVELSPAARAHLAAQYPNQCLCRKCLLEFSI